MRRDSRSGTFPCQLLAAQEYQLTFQSSTRGDPAPHQGRIHQIQRSRRAGIGHFAAVGVQVPRRVETEASARRHTNLVVCGTMPRTIVHARRAIAVDDDPSRPKCAGYDIIVEVGSDPAAAIIGNPDYRIARAYPLHRSRAAVSKNVANFISPPWFELVRRPGS